TLLEQVNPAMNAFDLWELTTLYQETFGSAYWLLDLDALGVPRGAWPLPSQNVTPARPPASPDLVDAYVYRGAAGDPRYPPLRVWLLAHSHGDLAGLADLKATRDDVAACFHVPLAVPTTETNLANLQAAEHQHMAKAVRPRLRRRDEKLNEQLIPFFDPERRLFLASDDPVPADRVQAAKERELDLKYGVRTVNEVRGERGLPPVPWGDVPFAP